MDLSARFDRLDTFIREDRIVRNEWGDGQERACILLAIAPEVGDGNIAACPASVLPPWLAELTPSIDDCVADEDWSDIVAAYARVVRRGAERLDDAGWRRVLARFMIAVLGDVAPADTAGVVEPVAALWRRVLAGDESTTQEWEAAAARAAKMAAWAVASAEREAADAAVAAVASSWAEREAAQAAQAAQAAASWASSAAREAAWSRIARHLFTAIDVETAA